jgi:hypothetical protein
MVDWQITATTIHCEAVDDEVTLLVYKDWSVKCTGYGKYGAGKSTTARQRKNGQLKREPKCVGPECPQAISYKENLLSEEAKKGAER